MPRRFVPAAVSLLGLFLASLASDAHAGGWQEAHQTAEDVRVVVAADGTATFVHHLRWRIVAGRFKTFELAGIDPRAEIAPEATLVSEKNGETPARVEKDPKTAGLLRISFDDPPKGLTRGIYTIDVKYKLDLVATKMITRDGAMWRLAWTAPASGDGHDGARVVFELPPAPTEPRLFDPEQAQTTLATLRREAGKDELELVRAHVPRGETVVWSARIDPKAFPSVSTPELRPPPPPPRPIAATDHVRAVLAVIALTTLAGLLAMLARTKATAVRHACEQAGVRARPLVPVPAWAASRGASSFVFGASGALSLGVFLWASPLLGAVLVVTALAFGAHRAPVRRSGRRAPGSWRPAADADVLVARPRGPMPGDALDITTSRGRLVALLGLMAIAGASYLLRAYIPGLIVALPLASASLVTLFTTGTRAQLPHDPADLASALLRPARDALARKVDLEHVELGAIARFLVDRDASGAATPSLTRFDEVRLSCLPRDKTPGLVGIELALAMPLEGSVAEAALPEVLVRFEEGSAAASRVARLGADDHVVVGRASSEKVLRLAPDDPTSDGAARVLARVLSELEGRRRTDRDGAGMPAQSSDSPARGAGWSGPERRVAARLASAFA